MSPCPIDAIRCLAVVESERLRRGVQLRVVRLRVRGGAARGRASRARSWPRCSAPRCGSTAGSCGARARCARARASRGSGAPFGDVTISTVSEFLQLARERRDAPVHLRALAVDADLGVHREGEVDRRRALGELDHVAGGREVRRSRPGTGRASGTRGTRRDSSHRAGTRAPGATSAVSCSSLVRAGAILLVQPVGRDAVLGGRCISRVRICISYSWRPGPKTVVCSDW